MPEKHIALAKKVLMDSPRGNEKVMLAALPSPYSEKQIRYSAIKPFLPEYTGSKTTFRQNLPPAWNQEQLGTCVIASSLWGTRAFQLIGDGKFPVNGMSVSYGYANSKQIDGDPSNAGTNFQSALTVYQKKGVCTADTLPYSWLTSDCNVPATPVECDAEAAEYKIGTFAKVCSPSDDTSKIDRIELIRHAIATNGPVMAALIVTENFMNPSNNVIPYPAGFINGGHGVCLTDLDDNVEQFSLRNTWGEEWADKGYAQMPYGWAMKTFTPDDEHWIPYLMEVWTCVDINIPEACKTMKMWIGSHIVEVDGKQLYMDQVPVQCPDTNRSLVPARFLADNLGMLVRYDNDKIYLSLPTGKLNITMTLNSKTVLVNGIATQMDQAPLLEEGTNRTVVPDRFIAEAAGYKVDWNEEQQMITFSK